MTHKKYVAMSFIIIIILFYDLWRICLDGVKNVYKNQEYCNKQSHPSRDHLQYMQHLKSVFSTLDKLQNLISQLENLIPYLKILLTEIKL